MAEEAVFGIDVYSGRFQESNNIPVKDAEFRVLLAEGDAVDRHRGGEEPFDHRPRRHRQKILELVEWDQNVAGDFGPEGRLVRREAEGLGELGDEVGSNDLAPADVELPPAVDAPLAFEDGELDRRVGDGFPGYGVEDLVEPEGFFEVVFVAFDRGSPHTT